MIGNALFGDGTTNGLISEVLVGGKGKTENPLDNLQLFSTFFIFLRHPRVGGDPDGYRSKAITIFTYVKTAYLPLDPRLRGDDGETC